MADGLFLPSFLFLIHRGKKEKEKEKKKSLIYDSHILQKGKDTPSRRY